MQLDFGAGFSASLGKDRAAAGRAEMPALPRGGGTGDGDGATGKDRGGIEDRAVMLAALHAMADRDPVGRASGGDVDGGAEAGGGGGGHGCFTQHVIDRSMGPLWAEVSE